MRRPVPSLLALLGVLVVLAVVAIQLGGDSPGAGGPSTDERSRPRAPGARPDPSGAVAVVPTAVPDEATPLVVPTPDGLAAATEEPGGVPADPVEPPAAPLRGRVIDPGGRPLPDVAVTYMPSERQTDRWPSAGSTDIDLGTLPVTRTGRDGRFSLDVPWTGAPAGLTWNDAPDLLFDAPGFAVRAVPCAGMSTRGVDLGDVMLEAGGVLLGRVVDDRLRPMPGVAVSIIARAPEPVHVDSAYHGSLDALLGTTTDGAGRFVSRGLFPGRVGYQVVVPGYKPVWEVEWRIAGEQQLDLGDIVLSRGGSLAGQVVDGAGVGVSAARVYATARDGRAAFIGFDPGDSLAWELGEVRGDETAGNTFTDEDGFFSLSGLEGGSFAVYVEAAGFETGKVSGVAEGDRSVVVVLEQAARLKVEVVDAATGLPLADAELIAERVAFPEDADLSVEPDGPGRFVVSGAGPVENRLQARAPGYGTATRFTPGVPAPESLEFRFSLRRAASLRGVLINSEGTPVAGAAVSVHSADSPEPSSDERIVLRTADDRALAEDAYPVPAGRVSGADGSFVFDDLMAGSWELAVEAVGHAPLRVGNPPEPRIVTLESGQPLDLGRIELTVGGVVVGRVVDRDGVGQGGFAVRIGPWVEATTRSDQDGHFLFHDLLPGTYEVTSERDARQVVDVASGETVEVTLLLRKPPRVVGTVTAGGAPMEGARIYLREADGRTIWGPMIAERTTHTDARGSYAIELQSVGPCTMFVRTPARTSVTLDVVLAWDEEQRMDVAFGTGRLAGVVQDAAGAPVPGARVTARQDGGEAGGGATRGEDRADDDGRFSISGLWPGRYTLSARADGFAPATNGPHELVSGEAREDLVVRMEAGAVLIGQVSQPGLAVVLDDMDVVLVGAADGERVAQTDTEAGAYRFEDLPAGAYVLKLAEDGEAGDLGIEVFLFEETVSLGVGEVRRLDVVLPELP